MAREDPQVNVRLPHRLKEDLDQEAKKAGRSLTAEIVARLESTFPPNFESEVIKRRTEELKTLEWQIHYLVQELEGERHRVRKMKLLPGTVDFEKHHKLVASFENRLQLFRDMAEAAQRDIAKIQSQSPLFPEFK